MKFFCKTFHPAYQPTHQTPDHPSDHRKSSASNFSSPFKLQPWACLPGSMPGIWPVWRAPVFTGSWVPPPPTLVFGYLPIPVCKSKVCQTLTLWTVKKKSLFCTWVYQVIRRIDRIRESKRIYIKQLCIPSHLSTLRNRCPLSCQTQTTAAAEVDWCQSKSFHFYLLSSASSSRCVQNSTPKDKHCKFGESC
jgi:hypothetical protein